MTKSLHQANQERLNHNATYEDFPIGTKVKVVCLCQDMYFFNPDKENTNGTVIRNKALEENPTTTYLGITVKWDEPRRFEDGYIQFDFNFDPKDLIPINTPMKTNDQKEFEKWWKQNMPNPDWLTSEHSTDVYKAWEAACKYKDKEIENLRSSLQASHNDPLNFLP